MLAMGLSYRIYSLYYVEVNYILLRFYKQHRKGGQQRKYLVQMEMVLKEIKTEQIKVFSFLISKKKYCISYIERTRLGLIGIRTFLFISLDSFFFF